MAPTRPHRSCRLTPALAPDGGEGAFIERLPGAASVSSAARSIRRMAAICTSAGWRCSRLDLDEVWWLVSPQNPLKPAAGMVPFAQRLEAAGVAAADPRIRVSDIEARLGSIYTADTLKLLRRRFPRTRFVWLMGGDNLVQMPHWKRWPDIFRTVPIAVFDRPGTALSALAGIAARRFARKRVPLAAARRLALMPPPAWVFFHTRLDPRSATRIRAEQQPQPLMESHDR